jgi:hypothetical protein
MGKSYHPYEIAVDPSDLIGMTTKLENDGARWYVDDLEGNIHSYGKYQKSYIDMVLKQQEQYQKDGEDYMVTSDDPMVKKVLEEKGIVVMSSDEFLAKMTGMSLEEVQEKSKEMPDISNLTDEEKEQIIATFKEWEDKGILKVYKGDEE